MANNSFELSQPGIEKLNSSLDKLVNSMNSLEKRLASLQKNSKSAFERVFGSTKDFDAIIAGINKLEAAGTTQFKSLLSSIKSISKAVAELPNNTTSSEFLKTIAQLTGSLKNFKGQNVKDFINFIDSLKNSLSELTKLSSLKAKTSDALNFQKLINIYVDSFKLVRTSAISTKKINEFIDSIKNINDKFGNLRSPSITVVPVTNLLQGLISGFQNISVKTIISLTLVAGSLGRFLKQVNEFFSLKLPDPQRGSVIKEVFGQLDALIAEIVRVSTTFDVKSLVKVGVVLPAIIGFGTILNKFLDVVTLIRPALETLPGIGPLLGGAVNAFVPIAGAVAGIADVRVFQTFGKSLADLATVAKPLKTIAKDIKFSDIIKLNLITQALIAPIKSLTIALLDRNATTDFTKVTKSLADALRGITGISKEAKNIKLTEILKVGAAIGIIGVALRAVAELVARSSEAQTRITVLAEAIKAIGSAMFNLAQLERVKLNVGTVLKTILGVGGILFAITKILKGVPTAVLTEGARIIRALAQLLTALTSTFSQVSKTPKSANKIIQQQIKSLRGLFDQLKKLKGVDLSSIAAFLKQVNDLFKKLASDQKTSQQLTKVFSELFKAFKGFKVNKEVARFFEGLGKSLSNLSNVGELSQVIDGLSRFAASSKNFEKSSFDGKSLAQFVKQIVFAVKELNSLKIKGEQLNSISKFLDSIAKLQSKSLTASSSNVGKSLAEGIRTGFLTAIGQSLFSGLLKVFNSLNPVALTRSFVQGLVSVITTTLDALNKVKELGNQLQNLGTQLRNSGLNLINSIGLGGLANNQFFQAAVGFEELSSAVQSFGSLTDEQLKAAQDFSNEIGIKYPQSSNEALQATLNLIKAGLDLEDTFTALPAAADLSAISDTKNLDAASKAIILVTQSFKDFNETTVASFDNASVAADILARGANNSTASVESLAEGLANVGPVASSFGLSLEETVAILGLFEDAGIRGAEGGTQLKSFLVNLTRDTPETRAELQKLGVSLTDAEGNFRGINDIINDFTRAMTETKTVTVAVNNVTGDQKARLDAAQKAYATAQRQLLLYNDGLTSGALDQEKANKKIGELTQIQANAQRVIAEITGSQAEAERITVELTRSQAENFKSIQQIAGSFGGTGFSVLVGLGEDAIKGFIDEMGRLPTAAEQAQLLLDNLKGDVTQLQGSVETLGTRAFLPLINRVFRPLVKIGRLVVDFFNSLPDPILETIVNAGVLVSILATLAGGALVLVGVLTQFGGVILTVVGTLGGLIVNLPLVIGALAGLLASFAALVAIGAVIAPVLLGISSIITTFFRVIENNVGGAGSALNQVQETVGKLLSSVGDIFRIGGDILSTLFGSGLTEQNVSLGERIAAFFESINDQVLILKERIDVVKDFFSGFSAFLDLGDEDEKRAELIKKFTEEMPGAPEVVILSRVNDELSRARKTLSTFATALAGSSIFQSIVGRDVTQDDVLRIFDSLKKGLETARTALFKSLGAGTTLLLDFLGIKKLNPKQLSSVKDTLEKNLSTLGEIATKVLSKITGLDLSSALLSFENKDFEEGARNLLSSLFTSLKNAFFANQSKITDILSGIFNFLVPGKFVVPILRFFGLTDVADSIQSVFDEINKIFRGSVGFVFSLLKGESLEDALFGNFGSTAKPIARLIKAIGNALATLVGIFSDLFSTLFPSGVGFGEGSFLENVINGIASAFEIFTNVILGPIRTVLPTFIQLLATVGKTVIAVVSGLFNILSKVAAPLTQLFSDLFGGKIDIGGFLAQLGPAFLSTISALIQALPGLLGTLLTGIGTLIGSPLLTQIGTDLQNGDFGAAITTIASAVAGLISNALNQVPGLITDLGVSLGSPLIAKIGEALATGNFQPVVDEVTKGVNNAIQSVPSLLVDLGANFGSPLLTKLGESLSTGNVTGAVTAITDSIAATIQSALGDVPTRLQELGATLNLGFLSDLGITLEQSELFQGVLTGLGNLLALPFETVSTIVSTLSDFGKGLGDIFTALGKANPLVVGALVITLGALFALLTGPAIIAGLGALGAVLLPIITPILTVAAVLLVLKNGIQAIADVISGRKSVLEGISGFFTGLASDVLGFLGQDITPEEIAARISGLFEQVSIIVTTVVSNIVNQIKTAFSNVIDGLLGSIDDAQARFDQSVLGQRTGSGDLFFGIQTSISENNFRAISDQLNQAAEKGFDLEPFRRLLRNNFTGIIDTFKKDIPKLADFNDDDFAAVVNTLVNANALDDAINTLPPELVPDFYKRLFAVDPSKLAGLDFSTIQGQLQTGLLSGLFDFSQVQDFILKLPNTVLTEEQKQAFLASLQAQLVPTDATPTEVPIEVTPKPVPPTQEDRDRLKNDVGTAIATDEPIVTDIQVDPNLVTTPPTAEEVQQIATDSVTPPDGVAPTVEVPVDVQAISDPETAQAFADALATIQTNSDAAQVSLTNLQAQTLLVKDDLTQASANVAQYALDVETNATLAEVSWTDHVNIVEPLLKRISDALALIKTKLTEIVTEVDTASAVIPEKLTTLGAAFQTFVATAEPPLARLSARLRDVANNLQIVLDKLAGVTGAGITVDSNGNGNVPGRESGGSVFAGRLYEVGENGKSELLRIGGRTYLIPAQNGSVIPASSASAFAPPPSVNNARSVSNSNSILVEAPINVQVVAPANANPQQVGQAVAAQVAPLSNQIAVDVRRQLRLAGSSKA